MSPKKALVSTPVVKSILLKADSHDEHILGPGMGPLHCVHDAHSPPSPPPMMSGKTKMLHFLFSWESLVSHPGVMTNEFPAHTSTKSQQLAFK